MDTAGRQLGTVRGAARGGAGRATTTREQSARLFEAIRARQVAMGWPIGGRFSSTTYYDIGKAGEKDGGTLLSTLPKADDWMRWVPGSAEAVALRGERPVGVEEVLARLRRAVEVRCSLRGWDPAARVGRDLWARLDTGDVRQWARLPDGPATSPPSAAELVDLDAAAEWVRGSAERLASDGADPVPLEGGPTEIVVRLDGPPGAVTVAELFAVSGRMAATAPQMSPEERARLAAVVQRMLDDFVERHG